MNCPKCGSPIKTGTLACPVCQMPVAMMSGTKGVREVITPPLKEEPSYVDPFMHVEKEIEENKQIGPKEGFYQNYGEGKKAVTSIKFLLPIFLGIFVSICVGFGIYYIINLYIQDRKEISASQKNVSYQVEFQDFIYTIDGDYTYSKDTSSNLFHLSTSENIWNASFQIINQNYTSIQKKKNNIKNYFTSKGYSINNLNETLYGEAYFLILEATKGGKNYLLAITEAGNSNLCFGIVVEKKDNTFGYDLLDSLSYITQNVRYDKKETSKEKPLQFDFKEALK